MRRGDDKAAFDSDNNASKRAASFSGFRLEFFRFSNKRKKKNNSVGYSHHNGLTLARA